MQLKTTRSQTIRYSLTTVHTYSVQNHKPGVVEVDPRRPRSLLCASCHDCKRSTADVRWLSTLIHVSRGLPNQQTRMAQCEIGNICGK